MRNASTGRIAVLQLFSGIPGPFSKSDLSIICHDNLRLVQKKATQSLRVIGIGYGLP